MFPRLEGYNLDEARKLFQQSLAMTGGYMEDELSRQQALRWGALGKAGFKPQAGPNGYTEDELSRQMAIRWAVAGGYQEDEMLRQGIRSWIGNGEDQTKVWLAIVDHLNQALPYVSNIVTGVIGARERVETMKLEIQRMISAQQNDLVVMQARNYWLAQMAEKQGFQIDPKQYQSAIVFGDALKQMGPTGQAYLNQGYNQAFELGAEFGQGGVMREGYVNLKQNEWAKTTAAKNLGWVIAAVIGGTVILGGGILTTIVLVTRRP